MIDPELKNNLEKIEDELKRVDKNANGMWRTFWRGVVYGAGYVVGAIIILVIAGWILNIIGVIPAFTNQVNEFRSALESVKQTGK
jgi:hypothetical protein